ncbi:MAG: cyclase family protein [Bryobacterales bacterium]|nr:cyclase family protein [Bryobacteraceae bacterium]MDW8354551.1 cyclase family protein [Bryobacterales bacterium]
MRPRLLVGFLVAASAVLAQRRSTSAIDPRRVMDLTYPYNAQTVYWPTAERFQWKKEAWGVTPGGYWYASAGFCTSEHGGTHLDSPIHFAEGKWSTAEIPLERLIGPAVVVDIQAACEKDRDYRLTAADVRAWEKRYGRIRPGDIVLVRTGWGKYWPDLKQYLGSDKRGDASGLSFPGLSQEAAEVLVERKVSGVGIDTASLDYGRSTDFIVHRILSAANIYGLENVAQLERLPPRGATLIALPMKIEGGSGGPVRIIAVLPAR